MTETEKGLVVLCILLAVLAIIYVIRYFSYRKKVDKLSKKIEKFLETGEETDLSLSDNRFSEIHNNIADLEHRLKLEKNNTEIENRKSADFTADVSHQLKTPLAGLRLYCEMDKEDNPTERNTKELQLITKMEKLVYNLLRLEKIRSDAYEMNFTEAPMDELINAIVSDFRSIFPDKTFDISGNGIVRCDVEWLTEAIGNIIKNAAEHTPENGIIRIRIENGEQSVSLIIEDNGGGVPNDQLLLIFNRFFKSSNASPDSTGIGLAIAKAITEKHHGTISAENGKEGLKVIICIPKIEGNEKI